LACLLATSVAVPLKDIATTTMNIESELSASSDHFVVTVNRVDDLFDDDDSFLGERVIGVMMHFDIQDDKLLVNNVPVPLNTTSLEIIQAEISTGDKKIEDIEKSFDIGLLTVEVTTVVQPLPNPASNVDAQRITINARIIEVDGSDVIQTEVVEKIMEVKIHNVLDDDNEGTEVVSVEEGEVTVSQIGTLESSATDRQRIDCPFKNKASRIRQWWRSTSRFTRIVITSMGLTTAFGIIFIGIPTLIKYCRSKSRYEIVSSDSYDEETTQVIYIADAEKHDYPECTANSEAK
ncbi:6033_t:CDS:2, partial [Paraglomus occultum]